MFNDYYPCRPLGQVSDYSYCPIMKAKSINFYVADIPMILSEAVKYNKLILSLPVGVPYGVRTRVWDIFFPEIPYTGEVVSYNVYNELGEAEEIFFDFDSFDMALVPWEDIIA
ncbi:hypothetical protein PHB09_183 [Pseudomonas phage PHB09]|uniref:Uncharacterized protein n=1 Tax=Pseudomonas phage PHB09 TaxID=2867265 RepID=A0AAE8XGP6_9CAUD|nr:hypothetical protein QGX10_gp182 [Pseudomonas phage PHB09]UAV84678.1 hypothetical protein PHB09_183 [Pseudomonas phage PHB09]